MKLCSKCNTNKPEGEYYVKDGKTGRLHAQCKECYALHRKTYMAAHYSKYGDKYRARAKQRRAIIQKELQEKLMYYMHDKKCLDCGENDIRVLEFDHIDPTLKRFGIARGITYGYKWDDILDEIHKCEIVCSNCHKKRTSIQYGWYKATIFPN